MDKAPNVKLVLARKSSQDDHGYISLRILIPNTRSYKHRSLGYKIPLDAWNDEAEKVVKSYKNASLINADIHNQKSKLLTGIIEDKVAGATVNKDYISRKIRGKKDDDFIAYFRAYLDFISAERKGRDGSRKKHSDNYVKKYEGYYNRVVEYAGEKLQFSTINARWLEGLETHFSKTMSYETSLPVFMSKITSVLRRAGEDGLFDFKKIKNYDKPMYIDPDRVYLTLAETEQIAEVIYSGDLDNFPDELKVACFFLVECWAGLRFSDWSRFKVEKISKDSAIRVRAKKNGEPVYVYLSKSPRLKKLIDYITKHEITFDLGEKKTNAILGKLAFKLGWDKKITTHVGRHTCATLLLTLGYSKGKIAEWLGISEKTVDIYAKQIRIDLKHEYDKLGGL